MQEFFKTVIKCRITVGFNRYNNNSILYLKKNYNINYMFFFFVSTESCLQFRLTENYKTYISQIILF